MKKYLFIFFLIFLKKYSYCSTQINEFKLNYDLKLKNKINKISTDYNVDTFSFSIYNPLIYEKISNIYFGKNVKNELISKNTVFPVASISKIFTASLIENIFKEKSISLNNKINKWTNISDNINNKSVLDLINHTSLIQDYANNPNFWLTKNKNYLKIFKPDELIQFSENNKKSNSKWKYSNTNYILLGKIIEAEEKKDLNTIFNDFFLKNKMPNTFFETNKIVSNLIYGNARNDRFSNHNLSWLNASGAVFSTLEEILNYSLNYLKFLLKNNREWINTQSGKPSFDITDNAYLNGIFRMNTPFGIIYYTPGLTPGFTSGFIYSPCLATGISYSTNRSSLSYFHGHMIDIILKELYQSEIYKKLLKSNNPDADFCNLVTPSTKFNFTEMD